ncbi:MULTISPECIES: TetR/AcrR family transcriptional regulator [Paraburkholderia]|uniref:TetR family transcriptional regulator n=1 Tax=Paraburkholderia madseniana TaxID=2599607 RepID=A0A6N6WHH3_9BURK|nr:MULTISPECIES: TetR/AcrR family transcriptional regulator [Paraburkholderia]KAE8759511.1 TetR family transcriptional regulator [Paraburkholderia madseniana]MCX4177468.1 TetR/AcrR family transcriptional regulator [Paraburkholderia madseniana]MDQ6465457.1 TetR/AcrR family transcriptional regulator [Paraburkholderia madseniana]NPT69754.1 TetR family transcriptional regulator [Paraburkholderia madseniana]
MNSKASTDVSVPYHHGNLRNALIAEGRRALEEIGVHELSLRYLARKAGVSEAAPSHHFAGKEGLLAAIAADGFRDLAALRATIAASDETALSKAYRMMRVYVEFAQRYNGLFELMVGPRIVARDSYPELSTEITKSFRLFASSVEQFALEKQWEEQSLTLVTHAAWSVEHGLATLILSDRMPRSDKPLSIDQVVEFSISMFLSAVAAGASSLEEVIRQLPDSETAPKWGLKSDL